MGEKTEKVGKIGKASNIEGIDYKKVGLKAGLEIHQQLDTGKLFSRTPSFLRKDKPHYEVRRRLHAVAGESGELDEAVKHEQSLDKEFYYQGYHDTVSLVELDEEPPREMDEQALDEALRIALVMGCEIYPVSQIMRKTVINGSNTSGFQRTTLIAHDGFIKCSFGEVKIETVCLEEDSARTVEKTKSKTVYRLDRLGIPLVEIVTAPVLDTPEKIKECALKIGEILRSCKVKRGIGTIRQDVNISIKGHDRVEIKGFQDPKIMIMTVDLEIERQIDETKKGKKTGEVRGSLPNGETEFLRPMPGKARMYPETDLPLLKIGRDKLNFVKKNLPKLRSEIIKELKKKGLNDEMLNLIIDAPEFDEFMELMKVHDKDGNLIVKMVVLWRNEFSTKMNKPLEEIKDVLSENVLEKILEKVDKKDIEKGDVREVMLNLANGKSLEDSFKIEKMDDNEIEEFVSKLLKDKPGMRPNAYMGLVMKEFKGKVDAKKAMDIINRVLEN